MEPCANAVIELELAPAIIPPSQALAWWTRLLVLLLCRTWVTLMDGDLQKHPVVNIEWLVQISHLLFTHKNIGHLSVLFNNHGGLVMGINSRTPWFHLSFCTYDQSCMPWYCDQNLLKTSSSDVVSVLNCVSNLVFLVAGSVADIGAGEDAIEASATSWPDNALVVSYSGIVTRVFTWFLIIYFTILIITGSNIIKLDRRNNEGRENK